MNKNKNLIIKSLLFEYLQINGVDIANLEADQIFTDILDKDFKVFRSINETAKLFSDGFVNSLLQTTCSGTNVSCPEYDTRARALNLKHKDGLDLIFVLDTSSSITKKNFEIAKKFVKAIVDIFGVDRR